ncbi:hypothetical protein RFI_00026, partial [Reticulomyxa filosa]
MVYMLLVQRNRQWYFDSDFAGKLRKAKHLYPNRVSKNNVNLNEKEQFVLKYLDALQRVELSNRDDHSPDWNYQDNEDIHRTKMEELISQYCTRGIFVFFTFTKLKSFLQVMYRQLVQVYNVVKQQIIPLHQMILLSLTKYPQSIACNMYSERKDQDPEAKFFWVQEWKANDQRIVLLNQIPIANS